MARPRKNADASRASLPPESAPLPEIPMREQPYPLPEGWKWVRLSSLCSLQNGKAFKPSDWSESGIPIVRIQNLNNENCKFNFYNGHIDNKFLLKSGDLLFAWSGTPGTSFGAHIWMRGKAVLNQHIFRIDFDEEVILKYFFKYAINCRLEELIIQAHGGAGLQHVTKSVFENTPIPLPPREEQERIVGHIESLFARLDEARQKAEAVRDSVALRRAAILHKAFTGELTAKWREEQGISKESWEKKDFAHIITNIEAGKNVRCEERPPRENEAGIIKVSAVTWGFFNEMESKTCPDPSLYNENIQIKKGDFLFSRANTLQLVGNCVIVENITKKLMLSDKILRFSLDECTLKNYLLFFSLSDQYRSQIENAASGNQDGMRNISQKKLLGLTIPLPTLPEQREIVRLLDDLLGGERRIGEAADAVVAHIERMKKAILARAFRGELGRTDRPSRA